MPILGIIASSRATAVDTGAMFPLQVITVGPAGASSVEFTNIPNTYSHLQVRWVAQSNRATFVDNLVVSVNNDTGGTTYANHILYGDGSSVAASGSASQGNWSIFTQNLSGAAQTNIQGAGIMDFLDYANTNKNKTVRTLAGLNLNTADSSGSFGRLQLVSGLWMNTNAITSIRFTPLLGSAFQQNSQFALYAVKAAS